MGSYRYYEGVPSPREIWPEAKVLVAQREEGKGGFPHWQFCVSIPRQRFDTVRGHILGFIKPEGLPIWLRGLNDRSQDEKTILAKCRNYCKMDQDNPKKGGKVFKETRIVIGLEQAAAAKPGKRNDLVAYRALLKEKKGIVDIMDEEVFGESELKTYARYPHLHTALVSRSLEPKDLDYVAFCFTGPSGSGKTYNAWRLCEKLNIPKERVYRKNAGDKWWDGYDPSFHKLVFIDEYRGAEREMWFSILNDEGVPFFVDVKGKKTPIVAKYFIFASTVHPESWVHANGDDHGEQWTRRFGPRHKQLEGQHPGAVKVHPEDALFASLFM